MSRTFGASDRVKQPQVCEYCGATFLANPNRNARYCSIKCGDNARYHKKVGLLSQSRASKVAHQQDRSVWVSDYAERQKRKTLELIGGIKV